MKETKLKKGLTYISERTDQMRYSDKNNVEQWLHPISVYYPLEPMKRGQPVSAATQEDIERIFKGKKITLNPDVTFAVLTNPAKHSSCIGLAMEHCEDPFAEGNYDESTGFKELQELHIIGSGKFEEDPVYYKKSHQSELIRNGHLLDFEYIPDFLKVPENIGKKVFVKGCTSDEEAGQLTVIPEEAYLANNNIIQIGFIADTFQSENLEDGFAAIEVQIEGDDRGPIDHTQFELPIGESELVIKAEDPIRVFALGEEENSKFAFKFGIRKIQNFDTRSNNGYIGIRRFDGKTVLLSFAELNTSAPEFSSIYTYPEDRAFIEVSKHYNPEIEVLPLTGLPGSDDINKTWKTVADLLNEAIAIVAKGIKNPNPAQSQAEITAFNIDNVNATANTCYGEFTANAFGGTYEIYVSSELAEVYELISVECQGSYNNKGMAILADIRNTKRQNIIGVYDSGNYGKTLKYGERAIFTHLGVFQLPKEAPESILAKGAQYYLGSCGTLTTIPQSYYNTVVKIGSAENAHRLLVMCDDAREFWDGELPIGFMKPTVHGFAEYGYLVMDGETPVPIEGHEQLLKHIQNCMPGKVAVDEKTFILPKVVYGVTYEIDPETHERANELAQIKAIAHGIYQKDVPHPFVRQEWKKDDPEIEVDNTIPGHPIVQLPNIDVTSLVASFGIIGDNTSFFNGGDVDVKVFVDCRKDTSLSKRWTEVHAGFKNFNNLEFYGYEWYIEKTKDNSVDEPLGKWEIKFTNNLIDDENQLKGYGPCIEVNPFEPATSIAGMPLQIVVYKHDMWERQFDLQGVFQNLVSQDVISVVGGDGTHQAVSGSAVKNYINSKVNTKELEVNGKISLGIKDSVIDIESNDTNIPQLKISGTATLDSTSDNPDLGKIVIANKDKHLGFYFLNDNNTLEELTEDTILDLKLDEFKPTDFIIKEFLEDHKAKKVIDANGKPVTVDGPHGIINDGLKGNLHAVTLANLYVGNALNTIKSTSAANIYNGRIPYIHTLHQNATDANDYTVELPINVSFAASTAEATPIIKVSPDGSDITTTVKLNQFTKTTKNVAQPDNYIKEIFNFEPEGGGVAWNVIDKEGHSLKYDANSTIKVKSLNTEFIETHTNLNLIDTEAFIAEAGEEHKDKAEKLPLKQNALQALSLMPTAAFHYLSENDNVKRWFGIITERIAEAKQKVNSTTGGKIGSFSKDGTFNAEGFNTDLSYTFTEEEANSVKEYLNFITNENDNAQNILSTVGVLLEAAKETQMRLLPNEASIYGADANTIPGDRSEVAATLVAPDYATNTPTHLGLNRLVKALCAEVFLDADPKNIGQGGGVDPQRYSRLDKVCKAIYGHKSSENPKEEQEDIQLDVNLGTSMPSPKNLKKIPRAEAYTIEKAPQPYTDKANAVQYNEDSWISTKENNASKVEEVNLGETADPYDGIHDAVNRIALKLNRLTEELHEIDNINAPLAAIDRIRDNIETLLLEVYDKEYSDDTKQPFKKDGLSRIDLIAKDLYSGVFELSNEKNIGDASKTTSNIEDTTKVRDTGWNASKRKFNEKSLLVYNTKTAEGHEEANTLTEVSLKVPTSLEDLGKYANILDIIIDYIAGSTNAILKNNNKSNVNNIERRKSENLTERIIALETSLDKVTKRITDTKELEDVDNRKDDYKKVKDIDSFIAFITGFLGIEVTEENGQLKWIVPKINDVDRFDLLAGPKESRVKPVDKSRAVNNLYGHIVDIVFEMQADDIYHTHLNALLGSTYKISTISTENPSRNLTVEMDKLNRLFYGNTKSDSESGREITTFTGHNKETSEDEHLGAENFTSSVIDTLYASLYTMPSRYKVENEKPVFINPGYIDREDTTKYLLSDKISKENKLYCAKENSSNKTLNLYEALTSSERRTFLDGSFTNSSRRWNRFEAIEDQLVALRNMTLGALGNSSTTKISYKDVNFVNRNNGIVAKSETIDKKSISLEHGIGGQYEGNDDTALKITEIGGNPIELKHSNNLNFESTSAIGIAALAFNIAEHNHSAIAALNNLLFTRTQKGNEAEDAFYKQFLELRGNYNTSNDNLTKVTERVEALETSKEDNSADISNLRNKLGVKDSTKGNPGEWLTSEDAKAYSDSLKGMHDSLKSHVGEWTSTKEKAVEPSVCNRIEAIEKDIGTDSESGKGTVKSRLAALESVDSNQKEVNTEFKTVFGTDFYVNENRVIPEQTVTSRLTTLDTNWTNAKIGTEKGTEKDTLWSKANSTATSLDSLTKNVEAAKLGTKDSHYKSTKENPDNDTAWDKIKKIDDKSDTNEKSIATLKTQTGLAGSTSGIEITKSETDAFIPNTIATDIEKISKKINASVKEALETLQQQLTNIYKGVGTTESNMKGGIGARPETIESQTQPIPESYRNLWDAVEQLYKTQQNHESLLVNVPKKYTLINPQDFLDNDNDKLIRRIIPLQKVKWEYPMLKNVRISPISSGSTGAIDYKAISHNRIILSYSNSNSSEKANEIQIPLELNSKYCFYNNESNTLNGTIHEITDNRKRYLVIDDWLKYLFGFADCYMEPMFYLSEENISEKSEKSLVIAGDTKNKASLANYLVMDKKDPTKFTGTIVYASGPKNITVNLNKFTFTIDENTYNLANSEHINIL